MTDHAHAPFHRRADPSAIEFPQEYQRAIDVPAWLGLLATGILGWSLFVLLAV